MPTINLDPYADEPLTLTIAGREWTVAPPNAADGAKITAIMTYSEVAATNPDQIPNLPAFIRQAVDTLDSNDDLYRLALGPTYDEMVDSGQVPYALLQAAGRAAAFYWHTGSVDNTVGVLDALHGATSAPKGAQAPKDSPQPRTGHHTVSGSQTRTAGTPTTARPRKTSGRSPRRSSSKGRGKGSGEAFGLS